jgi:hypothetical protein
MSGSDGSENIIHDVSETGSVSFLRCLSPPHLRTETDSVSETSCFIFSRTPDDGKKSRNFVTFKEAKRMYYFDIFLLQFL